MIPNPGDSGGYDNEIDIRYDDTYHAYIKYDSQNIYYPETTENFDNYKTHRNYFTYDSLGRLLTKYAQIEGLGTGARDKTSTLTYTYDNLGRVLTVSDSGVSSSYNPIKTYTYSDDTKLSPFVNTQLSLV